MHENTTDSGAVSWWVLAVVIVLGLTLTPGTSQATSGVKLDTATMNTAGDWSNGVLGAGDTGSFDTTISSGNAAALQLGGDISVGALSFGALSGDVTIGNTGNYTLTLNTAATGIVISAASQNVTINSKVTLTTNQTWTIGTGRTLEMAGAVSCLGALTKNGAGTLVLSGNTINAGGVTVVQGGLILNNVTYTNLTAATDAIGNLAGATGTLTLQGNSFFTRTNTTGYAMALGNASGGKGILLIQDSATVSLSGRSINVGSGGTGLFYMYGGSVTNTPLVVGASGVGAMYQTNGVINGTMKIDVGAGSSSYGYYQLSGGTSSNTVKSFLGGPAGSIGIQYQSGGSSYWGDERIGYSGGSTSVLYLTGGTYAFSGLPIRMNNEGGKSVAQLTVAGTAFLNGGSSVGINMNNGNWAGCGSGTDIVNLLGGTAQVSQVYKAVGEGLAILNFNGGTLRAGKTGDLFGTGTNAPDAIYIYDGGAKIDSATFTITNASPLLAPSGRGISSITGLGGTNFIGAPYVAISGGGGIGATAVSQFDYISGTVTGIVVTSPGVGYSGTPTVALLGGGGTVTGSAIVVTATNTSGGMTKLGTGKLVLSGANTYTGPTIVTNGVLSLMSTNSLAPDTSVYIYTGATNNLAFAGTATVHAIYINGVSQALGVYGTNNLAGYLSGPGFLKIAPATSSVSSGTLLMVQ